MFCKIASSNIVHFITVDGIKNVTDSGKKSEIEKTEKRNTGEGGGEGGFEDAPV